MNEWERVSERLRRQFGDGTTIYTNWLEPLQFLAVVGGRLRLAAPNAEVRDYVQDRYAQSILSTAADLGLGITSVELEVDEQPVPDPPLVQHRSTMRSVAVDTLWDPVRGGGGDIAFMHAFLAQVGLPRKHMRNLDGSQAIRYERRSGNCAFLVQAGEIDNGKGFVLQPIPYGPKPRLMLVDICTRRGAGPLSRGGSRILGASVSDEAARCWLGRWSERAIHALPQASARTCSLQHAVRSRAGRSSDPVPRDADIPVRGVGGERG